MDKQIKERGIIFNGEMVRAILDGRKTQTRRIISPQPELTEGSGFSWKGALFGAGSDDRETNRNFAHCRCPFGKVGDRLWVREAFRVHSRATDVATLAYKASEQQSWTQQVARVPIELCTKQVSPEAWTPSIHMPRWASRITLEITDIRVERLNAISEQDALSEGVTPEPCDHVRRSCEEIGCCGDTAKGEFKYLWESIYGQDSWQFNPFVWVVDFKRLEEA